MAWLLSMSPNNVWARWRVWSLITSSLVMCSNPRLYGTKQVIIAFLTALIALLKLDFEVRNKVDSIWFDNPDFNLHRNMALDFRKLLDGVCLTWSFKQSQRVSKLSILSPSRDRQSESVRVCRSSKSRWVCSFLWHRTRMCCSKLRMAVLLTNAWSVVGSCSMAALVKSPSFTCAGQHLFPDGIKTLCWINTAVRHSADITTSFGPGFLQTMQYAWVFAVERSCKDTEGGLDNCLLSLVWEDELFEFQWVYGMTFLCNICSYTYCRWLNFLFLPTEIFSLDIFLCFCRCGVFP